RVEPAVKVFPGFPGGRLAVALTERLPLDAKESIEWRGQLDSRRLTPGLYRLSVRIRGRDGTSRAIRAQGASLYFEVRALTAATQLELLYRTIVRHFLAEE